MKICPVCSTEYPDDVKFCPNDGQTLRAATPASDLVGQVVADRYHVLKKLGAGGMGQVYLAEHVKMGRRSAIKVMNPSMVHDPDAVSRFNREAANASRISHPNVCAIYDFGETPDGLIYLAMELIEGEPLTELLEREGELAPARAARILVQVADALQAAHDLDIVHRDLKPDNIMVSRGRNGADVVKVVDFGIAKAVGGDDSQKVTKTGLVVGTPEFMSPEQLAGDTLDGRSDLYSLALVLYKMLTGKLPFEGTTVQETMIKRLTDEPLPLAKARPDRAFPGGLEQTLATALARSPADRYQSATKFANDVAAVVGIGGGDAPAVPATRADDAKTQVIGGANRAAVAPPPALAPPAPRRRALAPLVIGVIGLALAGGGYMAYARRGPAPASTPVPAASHPQASDSAPAPRTAPVTTVSTGTATRDAARPDVNAAHAGELLNTWFDRIDDMPGAVLRDSATIVYEAPGVASKDRALAAYLVANAYAKLDDRAQGCAWARRAVATDPAVRSYGALSQSLCGR